MSWFGHYDKYGFTKRVGEELVEYHRQQHDLRNVTIRPHDFTPWGSDYLNRYGARLLYGGVDRADVLDCVLAAIDSLASPVPATGPEGTVVHAVRASAYTEDQLTGWEDDPIGTCDRIFPGAAALIERYGIDVNRRPSVQPLVGAAEIGYKPRRHFGTFLADLAELDRSGPDAVAAVRCDY